MTSFQDFGQVQEIARIAERGRFDLIFMGDNLYADPGAHPSYTVRLEPMTMLAALATRTSHIGLGATVSTTYNDPWSVARAFASLDHISRGRAAWNAVTTASGQGAANFGTTHPDHASRYERGGRVRRRGEGAVGLLGRRCDRRRPRERHLHRPGQAARRSTMPAPSSR